jgi:hypothetical protein
MNDQAVCPVCESTSPSDFLFRGGASAKGVTSANLIDPERRRIDCIVDLNSSKQGRYVPGTGRPVVSCQDLTARGVTVAILMNPNYLLRRTGSAGSHPG